MNSKNSLRQTCLMVNLSACALGLISCAESIPNVNHDQATTANVNNRAATVNNDIQQVFGGGFFPQNDGLGIPAFGSVGNTGGFGFSGSIASILGNAGGFGNFGGFGSFASFLAGSLPTSPPSGFIPPPGTGVVPIAGTPPVAGGGFGPPPGTTFGPPPGSFIAPGGGFVPPAGFTPPAGTFTPPQGFVPPLARLQTVAAKDTQLTQAATITPQIGFVDSNLSETNSVLASTDLDFVFVQKGISNNAISLLAVTETVSQCAGGGTMTVTVDDVDPVGPSTGDSRTTTFVDCVRGVGGATVNGSRGFKSDVVSGIPFVDPVWSTQTSMFQNNLTRDNSVAGYISVSNGNTANAINVDEAGIAQNANGSGTESRTNTVDNTGYTHNYNFNVDFAWDNTSQNFTIDFNIDIQTVSTQNSFIKVVTAEPVTGTAGASPTAGKVTISVGLDSVPSHIETLTAQADGTVLVESDNNADGIVDSSTVLPDWSAALFEIFNAPI